MALNVEGQDLICTVPTDLQQVLSYVIDLRETLKRREAEWQAYQQAVEDVWETWQSTSK